MRTKKEEMIKPKESFKGDVPILKEPLPSSLTEGNIVVGKVLDGTNTQTVSLPTLPLLSDNDLMLLGESNEVQINYLTNYCLNAYHTNQSLIIFDTNEHTLLTDQLTNMIPKHKLHLIDMNSATLPPLSFTELDTLFTYNPFKAIEIKTELTLRVLMSIKGHDLTLRMQELLRAACLVVYLHTNTTVQDVIKCITHYTCRLKYIQGIPEEYCTKPEVEQAVIILSRINSYNSEGKIIGTVSYKVDFLTSRIRFLKQDTRLIRMLNNIGSPIDLESNINQKKIIIFKLNESCPYTKQFLVTFLLSKVEAWRVLRLHTLVLQDYVHVVLPTSILNSKQSNFVKEMITQSRSITRLSFVLCSETLQEVSKFYSEQTFQGISRIFTQTAKLGDIINSLPMLYPYNLSDFLNLSETEALAFIRSAYDEITPFTCKLAQSHLLAQVLE